jgi:hypothetical protein
MSVKSVQVNIVTSVDNFLALVEGIVSDVKGGKAAAAVVADAVPALVTALGDVGDLTADVKNTLDLENTVALRIASIASVFSS